LNRTQSFAVFCLLLSGSIFLAAQNQNPSSARVAENNLPIVFEPTSTNSGAVAMVGRAAGMTLAFRQSGNRRWPPGKKGEPAPD
jgi:hypothetical protein